MNLEATVKALTEMTGRHVVVSQARQAGTQPRNLAGFRGRLDVVRPVPAGDLDRALVDATRDDILVDVMLDVSDAALGGAWFEIDSRDFEVAHWAEGVDEVEKVIRISLRGDVTINVGLISPEFVNEHAADRQPRV